MQSTRRRGGPQRKDGDTYFTDSFEEILTLNKFKIEKNNPRKSVKSVSKK
jgi:hypothetical protein